MKRSTGRCIQLLVLTWTVALCVFASALAASERPGPEAFDGSFRLATGETITGGVFVENGRQYFLYLDTEGLERDGLFERAGDTLLRSVEGSSKESVEIEFSAEAAGDLDELVWRTEGREPIRGVRVFPHRSRAVAFESSDGERLQSRLLLPRCAGPHPVVVVVHGSGPVNRFGGPFNTFFLQHGVAVLAYDKRGFTTDSDVWREPDLASLSADAAAAVRFAAAQPELDAGRIGLFGSSQGGWVVPPAAVAAAQTDFMILRVGAALTSAETILHEVRQELRAEGLSGLDLDHAMALRRELYDLAMGGFSLDDADALAAKYRGESWYPTAFGEGTVSGLWSEDHWRWAQRNHAVTPVPALERFPGPVLWFLAENDENVPLVATRAALERAFAASPGTDQQVVVIDDAPHSFLIEQPDGSTRYADGFFGRVASWMADRGLSEPECHDEGAESPNAILEPRLLAISVSDLDRSIAWYTEVLGFAETARHDFPDASMRLAFLQRDDFELELIEIEGTPAFSAPDPGNPATRQGLVKIAFFTSLIETLSRAASEAGAEFRSPLQDSRRTGGRFFVVLDPDGNWVQVYGPGEPR